MMVEVWLPGGLGGGTMDQENVPFEPCCPDCPLN